MISPSLHAPDDRLGQQIPPIGADGTEGKMDAGGLLRIVVKSKQGGVRVYLGSMDFLPNDQPHP